MNYQDTGKEETADEVKSVGSEASSGSPSAESESSVHCPICGFENKASAETCAKCGQRLKPLDFPREVEDIVSRPSEGVGSHPPKIPLPIDVAKLMREKFGLDNDVDIDDERELDKEEWSEGSKPTQVSYEKVEAGDESEEAAHEFEKDTVQPSEVRYYFGPFPFERLLTERALAPAFSFQRILAFLIDIVVLMLLGTILSSVLGMEDVLLKFQAKQWEYGLFNTQKILQESPELVQAVTRFFYLIFAVTVGYFGIFSGIGGQTIGKALLKIRVLRQSGKELGLFMGLLRSLVFWGLVEFTMGFYFLIALISILFRRDARAPHDFLFGTSVFRLR